MTETLSEPELRGLIAASDVVLSLHRSEGFGLIPAVACLLGVPVVATGFSGNLDFMDEAGSGLVSYRLVPAADTRGVYEVAGAVWAEPDIEDAAAWLRRLFDDSRLARGIRHRRPAPRDCPAWPRGAACGTRRERHFMKLLVWHWGRRGAGPHFALRLARALATQPQTEATLSLAAGAEILGLGESCDWAEPTYESGLGYLRERLLPGPGRARAAARLAALAPDATICAALAVRPPPPPPFTP